MPSTYTIGYARKRDEKLMQPCLLDLAKQRGIELVEVDLDKPLLEQGPFGCIIHKLYGPEWANQLQEYMTLNPKTVIIDAPDAIERIHNRVTMLQGVDNLKIANHGDIYVDVPKQAYVETPEALLERVEHEKMSFPMIAKPLMANGTLVSHQMYLIYNKEGLDELELDPPFVLQEFVNHGGVVFKVYVAGHHVRCVKRRSLPDILSSELTTTENLFRFSQISNRTAETDEKLAKMIEAAELPPPSFVEEVARELRRASRLNLFNFDMIRDSRAGNRYLVIDINYFPGYAKLPGYEKLLTDFFVDVKQRGKMINLEFCGGGGGDDDDGLLEVPIEG